jgi:hypothetical protein
MVSYVTALFFLICCSVALQILVLIHGWGLEPKSWWWIIGGGIFLMVFLRALMEKIDRDYIARHKRGRID